MDSTNLVGVEVSNTHLRIACLENGTVVSHFDEKPLTAGEPILPQVLEFIKQNESRLVGIEKIGVAVPGLISRSNHKLVLSMQTPELVESDFRSEIETAMGLPIFLENDANSAAYGEFLLGAGRDCRNMFYITLGDGVGGSIILDGKIWRGVSGFAGEFGHIVIDSEGTKLEEKVSASSIVERTKARLHQDSSTSLSKFSESDDFSIGDIVKAASDGDDFAQMMLERTGVFVGMAVAGVINLLNVERIVVGGEVMQAERMILDAIIADAKKRSFEPSFESVKIVSDELGSRASAIGAALLSKTN